MENWQEAWGNSQPQEKKDFKDIPKGKYKAELTGAKLNETYRNRKDELSPRVEFEWTLTEGEFARRKVWSNYMLTPDKNGDFKGIDFLKQDLQNMGINISEVTPDQLPDALSSSLHTKTQLFINPREFNGKTYYNAYVNEALDHDSSSKPMSGVDDTEEIPF